MKGDSSTHVYTEKGRENHDRIFGTRLGIWQCKDCGRITAGPTKPSVCINCGGAYKDAT